MVLDGTITEKGGKEHAMVVVRTAIGADVVVLPELRGGSASLSDDLLGWASWLDNDGSGTTRDRSLEALVEVAGGSVDALMGAWVRGLRRQREGAMTKNAVELLRVAVVVADLQRASSEPVLFPG
jgi:hypothetical protein